MMRAEKRRRQWKAKVDKDKGGRRNGTVDEANLGLEVGIVGILEVRQRESHSEAAGNGHISHMCTYIRG